MSRGKPNLTRSIFRSRSRVNFSRHHNYQPLQPLSHHPDPRAIVTLAFGIIQFNSSSISYPSLQLWGIPFQPAHTFAQTPASYIKQTSLFCSACLHVSEYRRTAPKLGGNTSLKLCQVDMMSGIASMLGIGSSQAEITDDEASDVSDATPAPATIKQEKKALKEVKPKEKAQPKVVTEEEESLMVESVKDDEDEDDDEVGPDEFVTLTFPRMFAETLLCRYVVESIRSHLVDEDVSISLPITPLDANSYTDWRVEIRG